ncbi:MAG: hypothetical protein KDD25_01370 [Bdellovibrionales bacterium]|nr:hypothetical protein [Bdellovibrionales bacterium]
MSILSRFSATKTKFGLIFIFVGIHFLFLFTLFESKYGIWIYLVFTIPILNVIKASINRNLEGKTVDRLFAIIEQTRLNMKAGVAFSVALECATSESDAFLQQKIRQIRESVHQKHANSIDRVHPLFREIYYLVKGSVDRPELTAKKIEILCRKQKLMSDFRQRSGRAQAQARIQIVFLVGLYIATTCFCTHSFGWNVTRNWIQYSLPVFSIGLFVIFKITRSFRWKI